MANCLFSRRKAFVKSFPSASYELKVLHEELQYLSQSVETDTISLEFSGKILRFLLHTVFLPEMCFLPPQC